MIRGERNLSPAITEVGVPARVRAPSSGEGNHRAGDAIIRTKLQRPLLPRDYVHRPRLVEMLERGRDLPLTLVTAPAGYGKSCTVSSWLEKCSCPAAWLTLGPSDDDLRTFFLYFATAVETLFPDTLRQTVTLLGAATLAPPHELAVTLMNELDGIEERLILVLDDFHHIRDRSILEVFDEMLRHPPRNAHFVLIGRKDPFLPIASLRARGQVTELRIQSLRFIAEETASFLQHVLELEVAQATAEAWTERTEGWVAALRLAAISMQHGEDVESLLAQLPPQAEYVGEYLEGELLSQQPPAVRDFLLKVSIVDRFCAPLCDALCPPGDDSADEQASSSEIISLLIRDSMFVISLDQEGYWFRFHHLFRELLSKELERHFSPSEIAELHSRASSWFAENGLTEGAIRHALRAGDTDAAVRLVEGNRQAILNQDRWFVLERWLTMFPEEVAHQSPELLLAQIWLHHYHFDFTGIPALIAGVTQLLDGASGVELLRGEVEFFRGFISFFQNDGARSLSHLEKALEIVPESHREMRGEIEVYLGLASQMQGDRQGAIARLNDLLHRHKDDRGLTRTRLLATLVYIHLIAGDLSDALMANRLLHDFSQANNYVLAEAWSEYLRGLVHFYQNDLDQAIIGFQEVVERRYVLHTRAAVDGMTGLALAYQATGQPEKASTALEGLLDYITPFGSPAYSVFARSCQTRLAIAEDQLDTATGWLQQAPPPAENMVLWLDIPSVTYCRALLAEGSAASIETSASRLEELLQLNQNNHNVCQQIHIMPLLALAYEKQGRVGEACEMLEKALGLARPGGWVRPFVELGTPMADLLEQLLKKGGPEDQINAILDAIEECKQRAVPQASGQGRPRPSLRGLPQATSLIESLTFREQEVLELLVQRHYNKEIAGTLGVSLATVKTHVKHILQKLEVNSRREAITRANELGLLADRGESKT